MPAAMAGSLVFGSGSELRAEVAPGEGLPIFLVKREAFAVRHAIFPVLLTVPMSAPGGELERVR
jgi:hypothetical protein